MGRTLRALMPLSRDERGAILPLALVALALLGGLSVALLSIGSSEVQIADNVLRATQAHFLAEAGLEDAINSFKTTPTLVSNAPAGLTAVPGLVGPGSTAAAFGSYTVQYRRAGLNTVLVVSTGTSGIGSAQRVLRATMSTSFASNDAIRTRLDLVISGNPTIKGACGSAHANGNFAISGNPSLTGSATASGTYTVSGGPTVGPGSGGGKPLKPIPPVNPADFLTAAKATLPASQIYQMLADGRVLDGNGGLITALASGAEYRGWKYIAGTPAKWDLSGNTGYDGTYYLEGNVTVSGNPGDAATPWRTSIIATGDIEISGNPSINTFMADTLFVAGLDIKINGNPNQSFTGLIAAHEQVSISGNPTITGYILAEDWPSTSGTATGNILSGNPIITYDCGLNPPVPGKLQILTWGS